MSETVEGPIGSAEVAKRLHVKRRWVTEQARKKRIPCVRLTRKTVQFRWADVCAALGIGENEWREQKREDGS